MWLHPLTHVSAAPEQGASGGSAGRTLICHVEFKDAWHHTTKAVGVVEVLLYVPLSGPESGQDRQEARWELDLTDLDRNRDWFDTATRTYRFQLRLPEDLEAKVSGGGVLRLRVNFAGAGPDGREAKLRDDSSIRV